MKHKSLSVDEWMVLNDLSLQDAADFLGVSRSHLWRLRRRTEIGLSLAKRVEDKTGGAVTAAYLLKVE
jgi:predicted DNA-binding protein YlxM (UPF0122 family)